MTTKTKKAKAKAWALKREGGTFAPDYNGAPILCSSRREAREERSMADPERVVKVEVREV